MKALPLVVAMALGSVSLSALADWQLSGDDSRLWFGSVKNQSVGETHHLDGLSGGIDDSGKVTIEVATESLDTGIDIRDERMLEHLLAAASLAISAQVDTASFDTLGVGETLATTIPVDVSLGSASTEQEAEVLVARLSDTRWLVVSDQPVWLNAESLGLEGGIAALQDIAGLSSIDRTSPVGFRLMFETP